MVVELSVVEQLYRAVIVVLSNGLTVTEVAEPYEMCRQIMHRWTVSAKRDLPWHPARPRVTCGDST